MWGWPGGGLGVTFSKRGAARARTYVRVRARSTPNEKNILSGPGVRWGTVRAGGSQAI